MIDDFLIVCGKNECGPEVFVDFLHQLQDFDASRLVEVGGRFVGKDDGRLDGQCPGDGNPLSLPATQLIWTIVGVFAQADDIEEVVHPAFAIGCRNILPVEQGVLDIFSGGKYRQKIESLEDETNGTGTQIGQFVGGLLGDFFFVDVNTAAGWLVNAANQVEHGRLAAAGWAGDGEEDPRLDGECYIIERLDDLFAEKVFLEDALDSDDTAHAGQNPWSMMVNMCKEALVSLDRANRLLIWIFVLTSGILMSLQSVTAIAQQPNADQGDDAYARSIVEKADQVRFPAEGFQVDVVINTRQADKQLESYKYRVLSKGNENTVVMVVEPASDRGQIILMKGRDLWVFMPEVSQPVRISLAQRLTGQVANGDLARANFSGDYNPKVLRVETIGNENYVVLELNAVDRGVTYQRVVYWVNQKNSWPLKAEFYSLSNRLLKKCSYEEFKTLAGKVRPTRLVMEDALRSGEKSTLEYSEMKLRDLPDKIFTKDYLKKLD